MHSSVPQHSKVLRRIYVGLSQGLTPAPHKKPGRSPNDSKRRKRGKTKISSQHLQCCTVRGPLSLGTYSILEHAALTHSLAASHRIRIPSSLPPKTQLSSPSRLAVADSMSSSSLFRFDLRFSGLRVQERRKPPVHQGRKGQKRGYVA